ncbi:MAG: cytochrome c biogenesis protein CcsA [Anaeromyxobacter sp.]|nr:cytochrome c biogenesis protein CcsA [Anaeromyxobacter sp.]MBL0274698.1 cytochrome c biogenesis protein CcsA [Anaeromyxobacter sp.]
MSLELLRFAAGLYVVATIGYILFFARPTHLASAARVGAWFLSGAFVVHMVAIGLACKEFGGLEWFTLRGGFVLMAWLIAGTYLLVQRFYHLPTVGAFITPLVLLVLTPTLFGEGGSPGVAPATLRHPTLTLHIMTASLGVALFAIAFGVALMYLLQEREVKGKNFGVLFSRLPPLRSLDHLTQRLVRLGFVVFTVALLTGAVTASAVWKSAWSWDPQQISSLVVWLLYGAMVQLRHAGWHGRRYAILTMVGFTLVLGSMISLRAVPGVTLHTGTYAPAQPGAAP